MLRHADVWRALDALAQRHGLTPSGLARSAGLDPTTFNKSKRMTVEGKPRWPSTESLAKALAAVGATPAEFARLLEEESLPALALRLPVIRASAAAQSDSAPLDETGRPRRALQSEAVFPNLDDPHAFALEIDHDALAPVFRVGALLIVSPAARLRRGDRVVVRSLPAALRIGRLDGQDLQQVQLTDLLDEGVVLHLPQDEVIWISRIVWASQ